MTFLINGTAFNLTTDEEIGIAASEEVVAEGRRLVLVGLVGKILTSRLINKSAFMDNINQLWNVNDLKMKVLKNNHFLLISRYKGG